MKTSAKRFLFGAILVLGSAHATSADPIVVGAPANAAWCAPFGCRDFTRYQQIYSGALFPGAFPIASIAFPYTLDRMSNQIDPAEYELRLSTTSRAVGGLSTTDLDSNVGTDAVLVFAGLLAGEVPRGGALSFTLPVPFTFDPAGGNLLLEVVKRGGVFFGDDGIYLDAREGFELSSTVTQSVIGETFARDVGLVTVFADPVPEPTTMLLFGSGLAAGILSRRRRRVS